MSRRPNLAGRPTRAARLATVSTHLRSDPVWQGRFQFNQFHNRDEILNGHDILEPVTDLHVLQVQERLQNDGFFALGKATVRDAMALVCSEVPYHPIVDWLHGLKWDQTGRLDHWLVDCFGCEDSAYARAIGRMFLIAMVARIMKPGCQADYMLVLEGEQGIQKSRACRILAGEGAFDDYVPMLDRDAVRVSMALRGKWLLEVSEMDTFKKAGMDTLKAFVTRRIEQFTPKYGRGVVSEPRQCLFIGTLNGQFTHRDPSGARRFWPVPVHDIDPDRLAAMRDQLFAEAMVAFKAGERWWPSLDFEIQHIKPEQSNRYETEEWAGAIEEWINGKGNLPRPSAPLTLIDVWNQCLGGARERYSRAEAIRISEALRLIGWFEDVSQRTKTSRYWFPKPKP